MTDASLDARYRALHRLDSAANRLIRADIWPEGDDFGQQSFITPRYIDEIVRRSPIGAEDHVLDIGSGAGGPAVRLAETAGCRVTGIEPNEVGVEVARELARVAGLGERVRFDRGDARDLPYPDGAFDVAVSLNVLNVIEDKAGLLSEVRRTLRPGGRLVLLTGTFRLDADDAETRRRLTRQDTVPLFDDTAEGYRELIERAGFAIDEVTEYIADFRRQIARWGEANRRHERELAAEQGPEAAARHLDYFATYLRLVDEGRAANHLFLATAASGVTPDRG